MRIGFDSTAILGSMGKNRGIGNYALEQFCTMIDTSEHNFFFLNIFDKDFSLKTFLKYPEKLEEEVFYMGKDNELINGEGYMGIIGDIIDSFCSKNNLDIFYITSPFETDMQIYKKEWFKVTKVVATVYDIIPYVFKEQYLSDKKVYKEYIDRVEALRWLDKIFVISQSAKDDLKSYFNFPEDKIEIIWGGAGKSFKVLNLNECEKEKIKQKYGINKEYLMCTGGDDNRKNIQSLIESYAKVSIEIRDEHQLVIVCKLSHESVNKYKSLANKLGVQNSLILTNFVPQYDLVALYNMAKLVVFPALYEGFGLPIVEAWACGTPVLTSNNSSLVQIAGDAAIIVDPEDNKSIRAGIEYGLSEADLQEYTKKGIERLNELFNWDKVVIDVISSMGKLLEKKGQADIKKKIAFFTPLPSIKSGISDYSVDILNALIEYYDIDVYIDKGYKVNCDINKRIKVFAHRKYEKNKEKYFDTIYQVGNSEYHIYMFEYIKKYKGIVVLHDYNLQGVARNDSLYIRKGDIELYKEYLLCDFTRGEVNCMIKNDINMTKEKEYPINGFVTNFASKIIVHSKSSQSLLFEKDISRQVYLIPSYAKIEDIKDAKTSKEKLGISEAEIIFASFGFVQTTKRHIPIIKAFSKITSKYNNVRYIFVGELNSQEKDFYKEIDRLKLRGKVKVIGYTTLEQFTSHIDATDVCFNLRHPYNGETSGSLMRILAKGKCVVVNDVGSFGELEESICIKLPPVETITEEEEVELIFKTMEDLLINKSKITEIGKNARQYAEDYLDLDKVILKYIKVIEANTFNAVTEEVIDNIRESEYSKSELKSISKTLGYCKSVF